MQWGRSWPVTQRSPRCSAATTTSPSVSSAPCTKRGAPVPAEVSIVGFDDTPLARLLHPGAHDCPSGLRGPGQGLLRQAPVAPRPQCERRPAASGPQAELVIRQSARPLAAPAGTPIRPHPAPNPLRCPRSRSHVEGGAERMPDAVNAGPRQVTSPHRTFPTPAPSLQQPKGAVDDPTTTTGKTNQAVVAPSSRQIDGGHRDSHDVDFRRVWHRQRNEGSK